MKDTIATMTVIHSPTAAPIHRVNAPSDLVKTVSFRLWTGDLWERNPESHIYVMVDGYVKPGDPRTSPQGRGITIGNTPSGFGVGFEHFGEKEFMVGEFESLNIEPNTFYDVRVTCKKDGIWWMLDGRDVFESKAYEFTGDYPSYDTVIGIAGDRNSASCSLFNVRQEFSKYDGDR